MTEFKVGDRVVVTDPEDFSRKFYREQAVGTILVIEDPENILVAFEEGDFTTNEGDVGADYSPPSNSWWVGGAEIELIR